MKKLDARSYRTMPWKNGGGTTTEIARWPESGTLDDFEWRISVARVASDGPFSRFAGVDRSIAVLTGAGMTLAFEGRGEVTLDAGSAPLAFPADVGVSARLAAGPTEDFNVMTRRGRWRHLATRVRIAGTLGVEPLGDVLFLFAVGGDVQVTGATRETLAERDAVVITDAAKRRVELEARDAFVVAVDLWRG